MAESYFAVSKDRHFLAGVIYISLLSCSTVRSRQTCSTGFCGTGRSEAGYAARHHACYQASNIHPVSSLLVSFLQFDQEPLLTYHSFYTGHATCASCNRVASMFCLMAK